MDVFAFPSRYEGLGMAAVEAQFCGVRTLISDRVPNDAKLTDTTQSLSLNSPADIWAEMILQKVSPGKIADNKYAEYDISKKSIKLTLYYGEMIYANGKKTEDTG